MFESDGTEHDLNKKTYLGLGYYLIGLYFMVIE